MSAGIYATGDELADLQREFSRELDKVEARMEQRVDALKQMTGKTVAHHPQRDFAEIREDLRSLKDAMVKLGRMVAIHQRAIEEISFDGGAHDH